MRLILLGTGHVLDLAAAIRDIIHSERPSVVALELDPDRYRGLMERKAGTQVPASKKQDAGRIYRYLARFQEQMGESFGVQPGTEMLVAAEAAQEVGAKVALIDKNAQAVVAQAMREMRLREKLRLLFSSIVAVFPTRKRPQVEAEIQKYQENPDAYLDELGRQFPTIRRALIDERDDHMAAGIRRLKDEPGSVIAVVGDGHVGGLTRRLIDLKPIVIRLKELRSRRARGPTWKMDGTGNVGFSFESESLEGSLRRDPL